MPHREKWPISTFIKTAAVWPVCVHRLLYALSRCPSRSIGHCPAHPSWFRKISAKAGAWVLLVTTFWLTSANAQVVGVTTDKIVLGQTSDLSGPLGDLGQEMQKGSKAYFTSVNAIGGVYGRKIELQSKDDGYDVTRAAANVKQFIEDRSVFCLFNSLGTPATEAILPLAKAADIPLIAPFTGAKSVRDEGFQGVLNVRAGYSDEAAHLIRHLNTIGIKKIALVYQNNSFGKEILASVEQSLGERSLKLAWKGSVELSGVNAAEAIHQAVALQPETLVIGVAGKSSLEVIRTARALNPGLPLYALSVVATPANLQKMGQTGRGVIISQVVPFPTSTLPLAREYRDAMVKAGYNEFTHLSFEGYINAKVATAGFTRAGRNLTRQRYVSALQSIQHLDLGGLEVSFGKGGASGSKFVELTMIDRSGGLIK
jgi:branched-chain amino acid transport system substrate-binding protein